MTDADEIVEEIAWAYAKANKADIARRLTDTANFPKEVNPVSVFMAGSPGAGKTETSIELLKKFEQDRILRIDPDHLRLEFAGYVGVNSHLFQRAVTVLVERIHDLALKNCQSFLLDGTLSNFNVAQKNVERSLSRGRTVQVLYIYQEPNLAWQFVKAREAQEGRRIRPDDFVNQYFAARDVVQNLKVKFGKDIKIDLILKNIDGSDRKTFFNVDQINSHVPEKYSLEDVNRLMLTEI